MFEKGDKVKIDESYWDDGRDYYGIYPQAVYRLRNEELHIIKIDGNSCSLNDKRGYRWPLNVLLPASNTNAIKFFMK